MRGPLRACLVAAATASISCFAAAADSHRQAYCRDGERHCSKKYAPASVSDEGRSRPPGSILQVRSGNTAFRRNEPAPPPPLTAAAVPPLAAPPPRTHAGLDAVCRGRGAACVSGHARSGSRRRG